MDIIRAKELIETLAGGVNPITGEVLAESDSCNQIEIVRALHTLLRYLDENTKPKRPLPENAGKPWTKADEEKLCEMFDNGASKSEICAYFKRTKGSISARLVRLGKITDRYMF
ncbi:MAG: hypothetical protein IJN84_08145 [Clostridia bacterium]|nr:hypothetical protein [Clostridia bacterium]